ncbi:hypothetical protein, partial [Bacillus solimangrovi]|uniref:hypothetical protein n=1 Tax=Bacillus solimangrovi TaxID=1305675 RepID=UPI001112DE5A
MNLLAVALAGGLLASGVSAVSYASMDKEVAVFELTDEVSKQATQVTEGSARYVEIENELVDINDLTDEELAKYK